MEQFTYAKRGYDPEEVDRYISTLEQVIKSYKEKDNAIKNAIISAQVAADNMIKNAKSQADEYKAQIAKELDKVTIEVDRQRTKIEAFRDVYANLVRKYLTGLEDGDITELFNRLDEVDRLVQRLKETDIIPGGSPHGDSSATTSNPAYPPLAALPQPPPPMPHAQAMHGGVPPGGMVGSGGQVPPPPRPMGSPGSPPQMPAQMTKPPGPPPLSLGPNSSPSLNKSQMNQSMNPHMAQGLNTGQPKQYQPPHVVSKINDEGNYVPNS